MEDDEWLVLKAGGMEVAEHEPGQLFKGIPIELFDYRDEMDGLSDIVWPSIWIMASDESPKDSYIRGIWKPAPMDLLAADWNLLP